MASAADVCLLSLAAGLANCGSALVGCGMGILYFSTYHVALFVAYAGPSGGLKYAIFVQSLAMLSGLPLVLYHADIKNNANPKVMGTFVASIGILTPIGQHVGMIVDPRALSFVMCILVATVTAFTLWHNRSALCAAHPSKEGVECAPLLQPEMVVVGVVTESSSTGGDIRPLLPSQGLGKGEKGAVKYSEVPAFTTPIGMAYLVDEEQPNWCERHLLLWTALMGAINGFLSGLCGIGGGMVMFFMYANLGKAEQRATGTAVNVVEGIVRVGQYAMAGAVGGETFFRKEDWPLYVGVLLSSSSGVFFGQLLFKRLRDHQSAMKIVLCWLLVLCSFNLVAGLLQDQINRHHHESSDIIVPASSAS